MLIWHRLSCAWDVKLGRVLPLVVSPRRIVFREFEHSWLSFSLPHGLPSWVRRWREHSLWYVYYSWLSTWWNSSCKLQLSTFCSCPGSVSTIRPPVFCVLLEFTQVATLYRMYYYPGFPCPVHRTLVGSPAIIILHILFEIVNVL